MDVDLYLRRIGYKGSATPTPETLRGLHRAHMMSVPFENLDIHRGCKIVLDPDRLYEKIVSNRRGGFCYELNGLFAGLLRALGFKVTMLSAGVARPSGGFGPDFDHMTLLVDLEERWLADVGFGESFLEPLRFDFDGEQHQDGKTYRISETAGSQFIYSAMEEGKWIDQYLFSLQPRLLADYEVMCGYHQTSPESTFTQKRVCSRATANGRVTLRDKKFIVTRGAERKEMEVADETQFLEMLREHFAIVTE